jgi:ABC-type multidrug transport system ATPase subunit
MTSGPTSATCAANSCNAVSSNASNTPEPDSGARQLILEVRGLTRSFPSRGVVGGSERVVGPLDLEVEAGERVALTGSNGSGKSTLLRCVAGTLAPSAGTVHIGADPAGTAPAKRRMGVSLAQERSFYLRLTGVQNLITFARLRLPGRQARAAVYDVIDELELRDIAARRVDRCSTGMVQQLAIARALIGNPPLLLLDEPTRSLDEDAVARLWRAVDTRPDAALVIATHRPEDVERCGRRLALSAN